MHAAPSAAGASTFFAGPQPRSVPALPDEEQTWVVSLKGSLMVVYAGGLEIARMTGIPPDSGTMSLQVGARGHLVPAVLRVNALEIYEGR